MRCSVCGDPTHRGTCRSCAQFRRQHGRDRDDQEMADRRYAELQRRQARSVLANYKRVI